MMFVVVVGAVTSDAKIFGPYGDEEIAGRARDALAKQGHEGVTRPLANGLLAYRDMQDAPPDPFNDWTPRPDTTPREAPDDVKLDMPDPSIHLCPACIDAYRNGIEPGGTACEMRAYPEPCETCGALPSEDCKLDVTQNCLHPKASRQRTDNPHEEG